MTKSLTEQWREGTLPDREYYVLRDDGEVEKLTWNDGLFFDMDVPLYEGDEERIKEVLAPVPTYEEFVQQRDFVKDHQNVLIENMNLKQQLAEANEVIKKFPGILIDYVDISKNYLEKWGVK